MSFQTILYEKKGRIGYITLNRPEALNAFSIQMRDDLYEILEAIRYDDEVNAVILSGAGDKAFCAGADLTEFMTAPPPTKARQIRFQRDVWTLFSKMPQPFIAALHGYVLGSGIEMSLFCDIRIASEDAWFGLPEVALGIIPAAGGTQTLPRAIGRSHAMGLLLSGDRIDAREAYRMNLVDYLVPRDELMDRAERIASQVASHSPSAVRAIKKAVTSGMDLSLPDGLELETRMSLLARKKDRPPVSRSLAG